MTERLAEILDARVNALNRIEAVLETLQHDDTSAVIHALALTHHVKLSEDQTCESCVRSQYGYALVSRSQKPRPGRS